MLELPSGNRIEPLTLDLGDYLEAEGRLGALAARVVGMDSEEVDEWLDEGDQRYLLIWAAGHLHEEDAVRLAYLAISLRIVPSIYLAVPDRMAGLIIDQKVAETANKLRAEADSGSGSGSKTAEVAYMDDPIE